MVQLKKHAKWAAQAALDAEQRIRELESELAAEVCQFVFKFNGGRRTVE